MAGAAKSTRSLDAPSGFRMTMSQSETSLQRSRTINGPRPQHSAAAAILLGASASERRGSIRRASKSAGSFMDKEAPPEPEVESTPKPKVTKDPSESLDLRALQLSRKYNLEHFEVKDVLRSLEEVSKESETGLMDQNQVTKFLQKLFEIPFVPGDLVRQIHQNCCKNSKGEPQELDINAFLDWYKVAIFTTVASLRADQEKLAASSSVDALCEKFGLQKTELDRIKKQFDKYDTDGSGNIEWEEFVLMMETLMGAKPGDIPMGRLSGFWREIDCDGSGEVDFDEFVGWYLKYFNPSGGDGAVNEFYKSYNPSAGRQKHMMNQAMSESDS